jgi:hypothetical protein
MNPVDAAPAAPQDSERKAFYRVAKRLKEAFPRWPLVLLMDGLDPNGPWFEYLNPLEWQFMIVLKAGNLSAWQKGAAKLPRLVPDQQNIETWGIESNLSGGSMISSIPGRTLRRREPKVSGSIRRSAKIHRRTRKVSSGRARGRGSPRNDYPSRMWLPDVIAWPVIAGILKNPSWSKNITALTL